MEDNNILFKIHNKTILKEILDDIPYQRLLKLSERNKKLQNLLNIDLKFFEKLSKNKNCLSSICTFLDLNPSNRENSKDIIVNLIFAPFIAYKHLKICYNNKIEYICKVSQRNNSFILCGKNKIFYVKFDNITREVNQNEILSQSEKSILDTKYPTEINGMKYLFDSKNIIYGIDLVNENKLIAKELYHHPENQEYDLIKKLSNLSFIIGTTKGNCYFFTLDPVSFTVSLRIKISENPIYNYITLNNSRIVCSSINKLYTINCINGKKINDIFENDEIISLSMNTKNNILASGSICGTLTLYSIDINSDFKVIYKKEHLHDYVIFQIIPLKNGNFCTCSDDNTLIIIDVNKLNEQVIVFQHCVRGVIELDNNYIVASSLDNKITIFNKLNGKVIAIFDNLFSVPKNFFLCDDFSLLILKFNGDVDIIGVDLEKVDIQTKNDNAYITHFDINDVY